MDPNADPDLQEKPCGGPRGKNPTTMSGYRFGGAQGGTSITIDGARERMAAAGTRERSSKVSPRDMESLVAAHGNENSSFPPLYRAIDPEGQNHRRPFTGAARPSPAATAGGDEGQE
jgi:hypothetical protein